MPFVWSTNQRFELTTNTIQIFQCGHIGRQCLQSLMLNKQSFCLTVQHRVCSHLICKVQFLLSFAFDGMSTAGLRFSLVNQCNTEEPWSPQFHSACLPPPVWRLWLHDRKPVLCLPFTPQRRQLPNRLRAPMLQESHELTAGLNYKVAFLQRSAFVSVQHFLSISPPLPFYLQALNFQIQKVEVKPYLFSK